MTREQELMLCRGDVSNLSPSRLTRMLQSLTGMPSAAFEGIVTVKTETFFFSEFCLCLLIQFFFFFLITVNYISKIKLVTWASRAEYFYGQKKLKTSEKLRVWCSKLLAKVSYTWTIRRVRLYTPCCVVLLEECPP